MVISGTKKQPKESYKFQQATNEEAAGIKYKLYVPFLSPAAVAN